jgi:hypothetical protein
MIKDYLNQPYPFYLSRWKTSAMTCIYIGLFMLIFQPFGLSNYHGIYKTVICIGYGFVTLIVLVLDSFIIQSLFKNWFNNNNWSVKKQIIWHLVVIFSIGLGNSIYTSLLNSSWYLSTFLIFQFYTLAVGIIPIVITAIITQNRMLSENLKSAQEFNSSLHTQKEAINNSVVYLVADNEKDHFEIELSQLLYIESTGNYIEIFYTQNNELKSSLLRSTLKRTESQLETHPAILKCHRAFMVNTNKIAQVKGNSQGLILVLKHTKTEIPVSRNFSKSLKDQLNSIH